MSEDHRKTADALGFEGKIVYYEQIEDSEEDGDVLDVIRANAADVDPLYVNFHPVAREFRKVLLSAIDL